MNITVCNKTYSIEENVSTILDVLFSIKKLQNHSLSFRSGCKSGVCGSCAVRVNGIEKLSCKTSIEDNILVEPLKNSKVIKDLVVEIAQGNYLKKSKAFLETNSNETIYQDDEKKIDIESNCILCNSCFSSCPVYEVNSDFKGPFALTRVFRYVEDKKEKEKKSKIDTVQIDGIWDCTLCGNCNMVCPSFIDIKGDILKLRNLSAQFGYNDPNYANFDSSFSTNFGFDPNGF